MQDIQYVCMYMYVVPNTGGKVQLYFIVYYKEICKEGPYFLTVYENNIMAFPYKFPSIYYKVNLNFCPVWLYVS